MDKNDRIYIAGHQGMVGSAIKRALHREGFADLILPDQKDLDLTEQEAVRRFFQEERPDRVFLAAARVGGIHANDAYPADFIRDNLLIQNNVIDAAHASGVKKLLFLGSSCIYPREAPQPMPESCLLSGPLEPTNQWYALAKIAGIKMCQAYRRQYGFKAICLMPTNLYGPWDNFHPTDSHVIPALLRRFHEAKQAGAPSAPAWGTGSPRREILHVNDLADACLFLMERYDQEEIVNVGTGEDISIRELAELIREVVDYEGKIVFDPARPDGTPRKLLDVSRLTAMGWRARIKLRDGLAETYRWYLENKDRARR